MRRFARKFLHAKRVLLATTGIVPLIVGLFTFAFGVFGGFKCEQISPQIFRGSAPAKENLRELKDMGIKTIISVRTNSTPKRARLCKQLGLNFFHIKTGVFHIPKDKEIDQFLS